jgi:DNA helicase II / ATP-dependent DNA helicase PcrA
MYLTGTEFFSILEKELGRIPYGSKSSHQGGPTGQLQGILSDAKMNWILAGPGTGKTETMVLRTLRLLLVEGVRPEAIVLTTFTERAAAELLQRLSEYLKYFIRSPLFPNINPPDISRMWLGTLHSLAMKIMGEFQRNSPTLISEEEAMMLFMRSVNFWENQNPLNNSLYLDLTGKDMKKEFNPKPIKWAKNFRSAINRIIEDDLVINAMKNNTPLGGVALWSVRNNGPRLIEMLEQYQTGLKGRFDFTLLQAGFLDFLNNSEALPFTKGVPGNEARPGVEHVIVDEYQDSNPIQERIYFTLAKQSNATLTVVGDDDQSLYRFRGANPDALVQFDKQCSVYGFPSPAKIELLENRRSHKSIVTSLNSYIDQCNSRAGFGLARSPKSALNAQSSLRGDHTPILKLIAPNHEQLATQVADLLGDLLSDGTLSYPGQVALLARSTKDRGIADFHKWNKAFSGQSILLNNPGAKDLHRAPILQELLGSILLLVDDIQFNSQFKQLESYRKKASKLLNTNKKFNDWFSGVKPNFVHPVNSKRWDREISLLGLTNIVLGQDVFKSRINDSAYDRWIVGWLLKQINAFDNIFGGHFTRGKIPQVDGTYWTQTRWQSNGFTGKPRGVDPNYINRLYTYLGPLIQSGGHDTPTDDVVNLPLDCVNALTVHQSKGLSFPVVLVDWRGVGSPNPGPSHLQETLFQPFSPRNHSLKLPPPEERVVHDEIRKLFVALSRAEYAVVLCLLDSDRDLVVQDVIGEIPSAWFGGIEEI